MMQKLYRLRAFPKTQYGGNKAGVYLFADDLSTSEMQKIAKNVGYSETAFVMESEKADFKIRFFTPLFEVNLCGHATIAVFNLLRDLKIINKGLYTQETKAGTLKIKVEDTMVYMEQMKPIYGGELDSKVFDSCFDSFMMDDTLKPRIVSTGLREIFLPVKARQILEDMKPKIENIITLSKNLNVIGIHVFALDETIDAYGRNFGPVVGIDEESATGTSNGALACYLYKYHQKKEQYILRQGYTMKQPSEILVNLNIDNDQINSVWVGGRAILINNKH
ncbi:MAG TPA: PhzF family phenazine biosynthesis protein [Candidatus Izemoplasmatales bacterium]|nr:PhzF family phenazine biosynthesis protein [Candidatus Izemoplasmatales bacterium]